MLYAYNNIVPSAIHVVGLVLHTRTDEFNAHGLAERAVLVYHFVVYGRSMSANFFTKLSVSQSLELVTLFGT